MVGVAAVTTGCTAPPADVEEPGIASEVVTQWNDSTELFLEYPHPVAGEHTGNWAIHLTDRTDYQPIRSGTVRVSFVPSAAGQTPETFTVEAPLRDGIFLLDPLITRPGTYSVELELSSPQVTSLHTLSEVRVYASLEEAPQDTGEEEAGAGIPFLKEQQWVIPFIVEAAADGEVQRSARAPAEVVPPDGALFQVSAPVDGIAPAEANRGAPSVGARVAAGQVLAVLAPGTREGSFAEVRGRVERLEREVERAERLESVGAIPRRRLEEARHDLDIARAELAAMGGETGGDFLLRLRAPIGGVIARRDFVPGGHVAAGAMLFTVVDPSTGWLRVQLPVAQAPDLASGPAQFTLEGSDGVHETSRLLSVGSVVDPRTRTVPVVYEVIGSAERLAFGQIAEAWVPLDGIERGITISETAVLDDNGAPVAYVQLGGEEFERRVLTLGPSDGARVIVRAGIGASDMVVVTGAYQVRLASLAGNEFAGGHTH
jgi:RND family efflux transporter MFP subunit